ncbi:MAG TPA: Asp23/Gls24 family envelope stress response protein [Selenomonadales bacterium]|nr:Asp23/Gls24 family envelope stress response protein [Selenomonadales bacterium]
MLARSEWRRFEVDNTVEKGEHKKGDSVRIADEVVAIIAGLAATEINGVAAMSGGLVGGIAERLGRKNLSKGVKVEVGEHEAAVELSIIAEYGVRIQDIALKIQENVRKAIESMTGLDVIAVRINVQGVGFAQEDKEDDNRIRSKERVLSPGLNENN